MLCITHGSSQLHAQSGPKKKLYGPTAMSRMDILGVEKSEVSKLRCRSGKASPKFASTQLRLSTVKMTA